MSWCFSVQQFLLQSQSVIKQRLKAELTCSRQGYLQLPWGDVFYCNSLHNSVACKEWKHFPEWGCSSLASHSSPLLVLLPGPDTHPRLMAQALLKAHQNVFRLGQSLLEFPGPCLGIRSALSAGQRLLVFHLNTHWGLISILTFENAKLCWEELTVREKPLQTRIPIPYLQKRPQNWLYWSRSQKWSEQEGAQQGSAAPGTKCCEGCRESKGSWGIKGQSSGITQRQQQLPGCHCTGVTAQHRAQWLTVPEQRWATAASKFSHKYSFSCFDIHVFDSYPTGGLGAWVSYHWAMK